MPRVLVVEDSPVLRDFLVHVLESDPKIQVVGICSTGEEAVEATLRLRPDVITMDINMPGIGGLEATRQIMETVPTPIVIVSGSAPADEAAATFAIVEAGALAVMPHPRGLGHDDHQRTVGELVDTVKLMSEVKVVRRWAHARRPSSSSGPKPEIPVRAEEARVVALGASTGGPLVLQTILKGLQKDFPLPILIVQHMSAGFIHGFAAWLSQSSGFPTSVAEHGVRPRPGHAYVAPDDAHLEVSNSGTITLNRAAPDNGLRPSVAALFRSLAAVYGAKTVAGLLSGMGRDGATELKLLRELGAMTFVQDKESSAVHGMAGEALRLGAAKMVLPPERIAGVLKQISEKPDEGRYPG